MNFKERVFADNAKIFLNTKYFAELFTIDYNGAIFEDIPAMLTAQSESKRDRTKPDYVQGLSVVTHTLICETKVFDGQLPHPGEKLELQDEEGHLSTYHIVTCEDDFGLCELQLAEVHG